MPFRNEDPSWRALLLLTATACTLTAASVFLYVANSVLHAPSRRQRPQQQQQAEAKAPEELLEEKADKPKTMANDKVTYLNNADACYDFVVGKNDSDEFEDAKHVASVICTGWENAKADDISVKIVCGGITNRLYRLTWEDKSVLVRLYGDNTEAFIDRAVENKLFALLSEQGFAPTYYGRFTNGRIEGWLDARPLEPEEMGQTSPVDFLGMIGKELGIMHIMQIKGDRSSVLWPKVDQFETLAFATKLTDPAKLASLEKLNLPRLHEKLLWLKSVLPSSANNNGKDLIDAMDADAITKQAFAFAFDVVFCHNDALSGNILHNDKWDRVQIIDYEYGGYNFRAFDFANHFCENCGFDLDLELYPGPEQQFAFFKAYMTTAAPELLADLEAKKASKAFFHALYDAVNRFALASHMFWGYWAVVQAGHSKIDFDFMEYAHKRFAAFDQQKNYFFHLPSDQ